MRRLLFIVVSLAALVALIRVSALVQGREGPPGKNQLVILQSSLPDSLDPAKNSTIENALPISGIYEGLVRLNPRTLAPEPCLAESWAVSDDGRRWTFHLKQGVQFSDGTPCDAEAVKASMARSMVLKETHPYPALVFSPVSAIETEEKWTVTFILKYPFAPFLKNLALPFAAPVVSPGALGRYGDDFWKHPSGTGPYLLKQFGNSQIFLQANTLYRDGPPPTDMVVIRPVPDPGLQAAYLQDGRADIILAPGREHLERLAGLGIKIISVPGVDVGYLGFYTDRPPFNNKFVRRAVAYALDRDKLVAGALKGDGVPAAGMVPPPVSGASSDDLPRYSHDQARRILAREGYPAGIDVTLITYLDSRRYCPPGGKELAEEIRRQLEPAGIRVAVQTRPWDEHKEAVNARTGDFFLYGWTGDNGDADNFLYTLLASSQADQGLNASGYKNEKLDVFLHTARRIYDAGSRQYLYRQAEDIVLDEVPVSPINHSLIRIAFRPGVSDVFLSGFGLFDLHSVKKD